MIALLKDFLKINVLPKNLSFLHILLLLYPILYFQSRNPAEFSLYIYSNTIAIILILYIITLLLYLITAKFFQKISINIYILLYTACLSEVLAATIFCYHQLKFPLAILTSLGLIFLSYFIYHKQAIRQIIAIITIMSIISIATYIQQINSKTPSLSTTDIKLQKKPNIYFILLESYHGSDALKKLYNYDNQEFTKWLQDNGFTVYNNVSAPFSFTRATLISMLTIKQDRQIIHNEYMLDNYLSKKEATPVINTLTQNNYTLKFKMATNYLLHNYYTKEEKTFATLFMLNHPILDKTHKRYNTIENYNKEVISDILALKDENNPIFYFIKIGAISENNTTYTGGTSHIPNQMRYTNYLEFLPKLKEHYLKEYIKENEFLKELFQTITKKDKDAMIIAFGDHGPSFLDIFKSYENLTLHGYNKDDYMLDHYNVMAAIKYPKGVESTYELNTLTELFPMIFKALGRKIEIPKF